jgi:hypothetical protein
MNKFYFNCGDMCSLLVVVQFYSKNKTNYNFSFYLFDFSVQFHPEHSAGPQDLECLFDVFLSIVESYKNGIQSDKTVVEQITEVLQFGTCVQSSNLLSSKKVIGFT